MSITVLFILGILLIIGILIFSTCIVITPNKTVKIIEQFGKYVGYKNPGISLKMPAPFQTVSKIVEMNIQEIQLNELTLKTKDNLFINFPISIQIQVIDPAKAAYELDNPKEQIINYLSNFIRTEASKYNYQELYGIKDDLKQEIENTLAPKIESFGFNIYDILVNEPVPSDSVKKSYDRVNESLRLLEAAKNDAEAEKIKIIAQADAEATSKKLQGQGIANQRIEISKGMEESVITLSNSFAISPEAALNFLIQINKLDTLRDISNNKGSLIITDTDYQLEKNNLIKDSLLLKQTQEYLNQKQNKK